MYQVEFNPVTIEMKMSLNEKTNLKRWANICRYFFNLYTKELTKKDKTYIGHIKVLALAGNNSSIKISVYKQDIPADIEVKGDTLTSSLSLLVNSFVYGINERETEEVLNFTTKKIEKEFLLKTIYKIKPAHIHD